MHVWIMPRTHVLSQIISMNISACHFLEAMSSIPSFAALGETTCDSKSCVNVTDTVYRCNNNVNFLFYIILLQGIINVLYVGNISLYMIAVSVMYCQMCKMAYSTLQIMNTFCNKWWMSVKMIKKYFLCIILLIRKQ